MRFGVLGPVELTVGGRIVALPGARARTLLAHLLVDPGRPIPADRLADLLWGGTATRNALQTRVSALRGVLDDAEPGARRLLVLAPGGYRLAVTDVEDVDAGRFRVLLAAARAEADPGVRRARLTEALALWRGPAFDEAAEDATATPHGAARLAGAGAALDEERLAALEDLAEVRLTLGEHAALAADLAAEVRRHPSRERLRAAHLRALAGAGRQADALAGFRELREHLAAEVGVDPGPQLVALHRDLLAQAPELMTPPTGPAVPAPTASSPTDTVIGRAEEIATVRARLARHRVVTLTGPGGVGKTRLALAVADELDPALGDGARSVALGDVPAGSGPDRIAAEIYRTLGLRGPDPSAPSVGDALGDRELLVVLDNGEHLVDGLAVLVADLVRSTRSVAVLVTSQEPLAVAGEAVVPVGPLPPPVSGSSGDVVASSPAARLFVERARSAGATVELDDPEQAALVGEICRRLDGLPLALELAAARVRGLGLRGVAVGTDDRFRVFARGRRDAPARHRSLAAIFDWAWTLLTADERAALRRLAVTAGGVERAAAMLVVAEAGVVDDVLARLVERSWVERDGERYRLLESVAAYAAERLVEAGEADAAALRHAAHFTAVAETAAAGVRTSDAPVHLATLAVEAPNLRRAHETAVRLAPDLAVRLVDALAWPWLLTGRHHEAFALAGATPPDPAGAVREWTAVLALVCTFRRSGDDPPVHGTAARAAVHADVAVHFGDAPRARLAVVQAERLAAAGGDPWAAAVVDLVRSVEALLSGDLDEAVALATATRAAFDRIGDRWGSARAARVLAQVALARDDLDTADALHAAALADVRPLALWPDVAAQLAGRGRVALMRGDLDAADAWHREAHAVAREHGDVPGQEHAAIGLGLTARRRGDLDAAEAHLGAWLEWNRRVEADHGLALVSSHLGFVAEQRGDAAAARAHHEEALEAATRAGDPRARALALEGLAGADVLTGEHRRSRRRLVEAAALRRQHGGPLPPAERADLDRVERGLADAAQRDAARLP